MNTATALSDYVSHYLGATSDTYNSDAYGTSTYGCATNDTACLNGTAATGNNLADTGSSIFIPIIFGGALLIAGIILIAKRLMRRHKQAAKQA